MVREETTTDRLEKVLQSTRPEDLSAFLEAEKDHLADGEKPLADYLRGLFKEKGIEQRRLFIEADILESYGYKLVAGQPELYARFPREAVLMSAFHQRLHTVEDVNALLEKHGMEPLHTVGSLD